MISAMNIIITPTMPIVTYYIYVILRHAYAMPYAAVAAMPYAMQKLPCHSMLLPACCCLLLPYATLLLLPCYMLPCHAMPLPFSCTAVGVRCQNQRSKLQRGSAFNGNISLFRPSSSSRNIIFAAAGRPGEQAPTGIFRTNALLIVSWIIKGVMVKKSKAGGIDFVFSITWSAFQK